MRGSLRVMIAEDELLARKRLVRLIEAMPEVTLVGACEGASELLARLPDEDVDLVLLDIQMPGLTGLEARALLPEDGPLVIFTTAHAAHAVEAFELGVVDYLLKPVEAARLGRAITRARKLLAAPPPGASAERIAVESRGGVILLDPARLASAVLDGELVTLDSLTEGKLLSTQSLGDLEARLRPLGFERVHRRALVNLALVRRLEPLDTGGYVAHTEGGGEAPVSRQAARKLRRRLGLA
jgi:two-component system LytT family response regulator